MAVAATSVKNAPISSMLGMEQGGADQFVQGVQDQLDEQRKQRLLAQAGGGQQAQNGLVSQTLGIV